MGENLIIKRYKKDLEKIDLDFLTRAIFNHEEFELFTALNEVIIQRMNSMPHKYHNTNYEYLRYINRRILTINNAFSIGRKK